MASRSSVTVGSPTRPRTGTHAGRQPRCASRPSTSCTAGPRPTAAWTSTASPPPSARSTRTSSPCRRSTGRSPAPAAPTSRRWPPRPARYRHARFVPALLGAAGRLAARDGRRTGRRTGVRRRAAQPAARALGAHRATARAARARCRWCSPAVGACRWCRDEPRVAAVARLDADGGPLTVVSTHLSFLAGWNVLQLRRLVRGLARSSGWSSPATSTCRRDAVVRGPRACVRWRPARRSPPTRRPGQLDHLLGRGAVTGHDARVWDLPLSDHRALSVELGA